MASTEPETDAAQPLKASGRLLNSPADRLHLPGFPRESEYHFPGWITAGGRFGYYRAELQARVYPDIDVDSDGDPVFLEKGDPGWGFFRVYTMSVDTDLSYELADSEGPPMPLELVWNDFQMIHRFRHWSEANAGDAGVDYLKLPESRVISKIADYEWGEVEPNEETTVYFDFPLWRTANTVNKLDKCRCRLYPHLTNCQCAPPVSQP